MQLEEKRKKCRKKVSITTEKSDTIPWHRHIFSLQKAIGELEENIGLKQTQNPAKKTLN
jgi:hypothetical protein